jgi:hypothetical protein
MSLSVLVHQAVLFAHVIAFAMTVSAVLREDLRWLLKRRIDPARLHRSMRTVSAGLAVLWITGLSLWAFAAAASPVPWALTPKLCAKLTVVSLLTLNGWALHRWVFPSLSAGPVTRCWPVVLGAFSSSSWIFASFVGVARPVSGLWSFADFIALYMFGLALAVTLALLVWRSWAQPQVLSAR